MVELDVVGQVNMAAAAHGLLLALQLRVKQALEFVEVILFSLDEHLVLLVQRLLLLQLLLLLFWALRLFHFAVVALVWVRLH